MKHKLTKFQLEVWQKIEPIIKQFNYQVDINFDDDFVVKFNNELGQVTITIHPNNEILYLLERNKGGIESAFHSSNTLDYLVNELSKQKD